MRREWHVPRLVAVRPTRVGEVSAKQVTGFFLKHARERRLTDWQSHQTVDPVQLLPVDLAQASVDSAPKLDYWREAGHALTEQAAHGGRQDTNGDGVCEQR